MEVLAKYFNLMIVSPLIAVEHCSMYLTLHTVATLPIHSKIMHMMYIIIHRCGGPHGWGKNEP